MKKKNSSKKFWRFIKSSLAIALVGTCVNVVPVLAEGEEGSGDDLILNRPEQSSTVRTDLGNPEATKNEDPDSNLPSGYEVLLGEDGIFRVTYTIDKDCEDDYVYIDLNKAMEYAKNYCGQTDSTWLEPGDTRIVQFYIKSDSKYTYKYVDGSFALTTPNYGTNQTSFVMQKDENGNLVANPDGIPVIDNPEEGDIVGFDKQVISKSRLGVENFSLSITSPSVEALFVQLGFFTQDDADHNWQSAYISYPQYCTLKKYLNENFGTSDVVEGMKQYLIKYYSEKDGVEYTDFNTMMKESSKASNELYSDTSTNKYLIIDNLDVTNQGVVNTLIGNSSATMSVRFPALQNLLNEKLGTSYSFTGTSSSNWSKLKNALSEDGYQDIANLVPTSYSNSSYVTKYISIYNKLSNDEKAAYNDYLDMMQYDSSEFVVKENANSYYSTVLTTKNVEKKPSKIILELDRATRYNNFYQNLLSVVVTGTQKDVNAVTGGQSGIVQTVTKTVYTVTDADDGIIYKNCVPASEIGPDLVNFLDDYYGLPSNTLVKDKGNGNYTFGFGTTRGTIATTDYFDGKVSEIYVSKMPEYVNDDWSTSNRAPQLADYMSKNNTAWQDANNVFKNLFEKLPNKGITKGDTPVTAFMAFNLDGPLTGNDYQDTAWSWASSIKLERVKGEVIVNKTDEDHITIDRASSDAKFALWQIKDEVDEDGNPISKKYYLKQEENDGDVKYSWIEDTNDKMNITVTAAHGVLDVNDMLLDGVVYYLQEVSAPKGYQKDSKIFVICRENEYEAACAKLNTNNKTVWAGKVDDEEPVEIEAVNPKLVTISVTKAWNDNENQDGKRPDRVTVHLYADGKDTGKSLVLNEENKWTNTFKDLDKYKYSDSGEQSKIVYTIEEDEVDGYTNEIKNTENDYVITNSHTPETVTVSGSKIWEDNENQDGVRPESITIRLKKNGTEINSQTVTSENGWSWSFENLAKYENGKEVSYTVTEDAINNYSTSYSSDSYDVTNTHEVDQTSVTVTKAWDDNSNQDGKRPDSVTVHLYADREDTGKSLVLSEDNKWTDSFKDLDVNKDGNEITYTVVEDSVEDYATTITGDAEVGYTITNSHDVIKTNVNVSKSWNDANNQDGKRPSEINVYLLENGADTGKVVTLSEENGWAGSFTDLDVYKDGTPIEYTVEEEIVEDYTSEITQVENGYVITNSHTPETVTITGTKTWNDNNNQDGVRPTSIIIKLMSGETLVDTRTVTEADGWSWNFENVAKYANGQEIAYNIVEEPVDGYSTEVDGYDVTNTIIPTETPEPERPETPITPDEEEEEPERPVTPTTPDNNNRVERPSTPTTGDETNNGLAGTVFVVSMLAVALLLKKKHSAQ